MSTIKCNQCNIMRVTLANMSEIVHEKGCPNEHKVWDSEEEQWVDGIEDEDVDELT